MLLFLFSEKGRAFGTDRQCICTAGPGIQGCYGQFLAALYAIFETQQDNYDIWSAYFSEGKPDTLDPFEKQALASSLRQMLIRANEVQWVVLYNPDRADNYILYSDSTGLRPLPDDFPFLDALRDDCQNE